jgi:hypothetical protein
MRTRAEHLAWCKERALEYLEHNQLVDAVTSMASDLEKHPETQGISAYLTMAGMLSAQQGDRAGVRRWIEGFR